MSALRSKIRKTVRHPLSPFKWRTLHSLLVLFMVVVFGTVVMHYLEDWSYVDAFYFMSLIATTQGPTASPHTDAGKIFASIMAYVSVGTALSAAAFIFGPFLGAILKVGIDHVENRKAEERAKTVTGHERDSERHA